jgi:phosphoglycerol transferase MdoB-like AlkP superfamily enzyme
MNYSSGIEKTITRNNLMRSVLDGLRANVVWYFTIFSLMCKTSLFLSLIPNSSASKIEFFKFFYSNPHFSIFICFIVIFASLTFLFKGRQQLWFLFTLNFLVSFLLISDLWYYRGFGAFLSLHQFKQTSNLENLGDAILSMFRYIDLLFTIDLLVLTLVLFLKKELSRTNKRNVKISAVLMLVSILYITIFHYKVDIVEQGQKDILFRICWTPNQTITNLSPIGYHIYDSYMFYKESLPYKLKEEEKTEIDNWFLSKKENLPYNEYKSKFKGKNLIFIQIESLENFVLNQKINGQEITPNLNKLLKNSIYFSNFHEQVYYGTSSDADLLANTSVYPVRRGSTFFRYPSNTYNSLPKLLEEQGYTTTAIHPDKGSYWNWMPALTSFGFDKCIDSNSFSLDETIGLGISDESFFRQVEPLIKAEKEPFYTFMVTLTSHGPFNIPDEYRYLELNSDLDKTYMGGYFQSVHYTDKQIGTFIDKLEKDGALDNTIIALYGDHCGVHKYYSEEVEKITSSEEWWLNNNMRIPFMIYSKDLKGEEIKINGGQIDILPTIAYILGIEEEKYIYSAMGRNLLNTKKDFAVLANKTIIGGLDMTELEKQDALKGIDIADKIIQSNYFNSK